MTDVHVDLVHGEDAADFSQNGGTRSLHAICAQQSVDVVGVDAILVDDTLSAGGSELPQPGDVRAVCRELRRGRVEMSVVCRRRDMMRPSAAG